MRIVPPQPPHGPRLHIEPEQPGPWRCPLWAKVAAALLLFTLFGVIVTAAYKAGCEARRIEQEARHP